jgi:hypothetical protein
LRRPPHAAQEDQVDFSSYLTTGQVNLAGVSWAKPAHVHATFRGYRWTKYLINEYAAYARQAYTSQMDKDRWAQYICEKYNRKAPASKRLAQLSINYMMEQTPKGEYGPPAAPQRLVFTNWDCVMGGVALDPLKPNPAPTPTPAAQEPHPDTAAPGPSHTHAAASPPPWQPPQQQEVAEGTAVDISDSQSQASAAATPSETLPSPTGADVGSAEPIQAIGEAEAQLASDGAGVMVEQDIAPGLPGEGEGEGEAGPGGLAADKEDVY